jgi:O-antigen/teichoic acid export membrane protein
MTTPTTPPAPSGLLAQLRMLGSHSAIFGAADVFSRVISFLLIPLYLSYLTPVDFRDLALLLLLGAVAKVAFRLGLDGGFFRTYYDCEGEARRQLAGSIALFSAGFSAALLWGAYATRYALTDWLLGDRPAHWVVLVTTSIALASVSFVPQSLLRIQSRPGLFSVFAVARHTVNIVLKIVLVVRGHGVGGVLWADVIAAGIFSLSLLPILWRNANFRVFDARGVGAALGFGLPKVPHGFLVQIQNLADRKLLDWLPGATQAEVGIYHLACSFGAAVKFPLSAFEPAWQPFVYSEAPKPDSPKTLARVITYAWLAFVAVGLALSVYSRELLVFATPRSPEFRQAATVIPVIVLAYLFHGAFLLTSIGIGVRKKTRYMPLISTASAATNLGANVLLIPRYGIMGAAWATVASYVVMAALGLRIGQGLFPLPLENARLARVTLIALALYALSTFAPAAMLAALIVKSALLLALPVLLLASGFANDVERAWLRTRLGLTARPRT